MAVLKRFDKTECPVCGSNRHKCFEDHENKITCLGDSGTDRGTEINGYISLGNLFEALTGEATHYVLQENFNGKEYSSNDSSGLYKKAKAESQNQRRKNPKHYEALEELSTYQKNKPTSIDDWHHNIEYLLDNFDLTKADVDRLNRRAGMPMTKEFWMSLGFRSITQIETPLVQHTGRAVARYIPGVKGKNSFGTCGTKFYSKEGKAMFVPIRNIDGKYVGYQLANHRYKPTNDIPKYSWVVHTEHNVKVNNYELRISDLVFEAPLQVYVSNVDNVELFVCEGSLKPIIAALRLGHNFIGNGFNDLNKSYHQLKATISKLKPEYVRIMPDAGSLANKDVLGKIRKNIEALNEIRNELGLDFSITIGDYGQLWDKSSLGDIDEIKHKFFNRCNWLPATVSEDEGGTFSSNLIASYIYYISNDKKSEKTSTLNALNPIQCKGLKHENFHTHSEWKSEIAALSISFPLISRFLNKEKLSPSEYAVIASSLAHLGGGAKFYKKHLHEYYSKGTKKRGEKKYKVKGSVDNVKDYCKLLKDYGFPTYSLPGSKHSLYQLLLKSNIVQLETPELKKLADIRRDLATEIEKFINGSGDAVTTLKVPTGVGKTQYLTKNEIPNAAIGFKTYDLMDEFYEKVTYPCVKQPRLPELPAAIANQINYFYSRQQFKKVRDMLYKIAKKDTKIGDFDLVVSSDVFKAITNKVRVAVSEYLTRLEALRNSDKTILATHKHIAYHREDFNDRTIIFDEDPLNVYVGNTQMTLKELDQFKGHPDLNKMIFEVEDLVKSAKNNVFVPLPEFDVKLKELIGFFDIDLVSKFSSLFHAQGFVRNNTTFTIIQEAIPLPKSKVLILSATPITIIWKKLAPNRFNAVELNEVELKGVINQLADHSYSKTRLGGGKDKNQTNKYMAFLQGMLDDTTKITFKSHKHLFENSHQTMHFGNCLGYNELSGSHLDIIGTPQLPASVIIAIAASIGMDVANKNLTFKNQIIKYNGYRFPFCCFEDEDLRNIQFELINSDLEQGVGRARLVHHDVTVCLFSSFPLKQSNLYDNVSEFIDNAENREYNITQDSQQITEETNGKQPDNRQEIQPNTPETTRESTPIRSFDIVDNKQCSNTEILRCPIYQQLQEKASSSETRETCGSEDNATELSDAVLAFEVLDTVEEIQFFVRESSLTQDTINEAFYSLTLEQQKAICFLYAQVS